MQGCKLFGPFVHIILKYYKHDEPVTAKQNAFDILLSAWKPVKLEYPEIFGSNPDECTRGD